MNAGRKQFAPGTTIVGRYEVVKALGEGGMGTVVLVRDQYLEGEETALKILGKEHLHDETQLGRFRNEVVLARKLSHPNIVRVYDFGTAPGGNCFINMEFVQSGALTQRIHGRGVSKYSFDETCVCLAQLCSALACAHCQGVVHRDLKPDNILISEDGLAKITDFGLARSMHQDKQFTQTGETVGTPYYMSPEQLAGEDLTPKVDIYSLGIIAYELVTGKRPFVSENYLELAQMHMTKELPSITSIHPDIPKWFEEFVKVCASKTLQDRFSDALEALFFLAEKSEAVLTSKRVRLPIGRKPVVSLQ